MQIERRAAAAGWIREFPKRVRTACQRSDDVLDALLCGLIARVASLRQTAWPEPTALGLAEVEGWIHIPLPDSFEDLGAKGEMIPPLRKGAKLPTWPGGAVTA